MDPISLKEFSQEAASFDRTVLESPAIDQFCSASDWILPANAALMPGREPWIHRGDEGFATLMRGQHSEGWRYVEPFEAMWGLACPLVGADPYALTEEFASLCRRREDDWDIALLSGLPIGSVLLTRVHRLMSAHYEVMQQATTRRHVASLDDGLDGFLSRRSVNFRRNMRKAQRGAARAGIKFVFDHATEPDAIDAVYDRILAVERRSWKGRSGIGIDSGGMTEFYRLMVQRLGRQSRLRVVFARLEDRDVAYCLGGVLEDSYRGLQMSYDHELRKFGLGGLCQLRQIAELCDQCYRTYDLGTGLEYKLRWAEATDDSVVLVVVKVG